MTRKLGTFTWLFSFFPLKSLVLGHGNKITKLTGLSNVHVALHWDKTQGTIFGSYLSTQGSGHTVESHVQKYNSYRFKL